MRAMGCANGFPCLALLFLGALCSVSAEREEDRASQFVAQRWLGNKIRFGKWNTIWVDVISGREGCRGTLVYSNPSGMGVSNSVRPVNVPAESHVRLPLYIIPRAGRGRLSFQPSGRRAALAIDLPETHGNNLQRDTWTIGVMGRASVVLPKPLEVKSGTATNAAVRLTRNTFPGHVRGFDALDALVWEDPDFSELTVAKVEALRQWVLEGGELTVVPGARWQQLRLSPLADILPALPTDPRERRDWGLIRRRAHTKSVPGGGALLWRLSDTAEAELWRRHRAGAGRVTLLAFNPGEATFREWSDMPDLWYEVLDLATVEWRAIWKSEEQLTGYNVPFWSLLENYAGVTAIPFGKILFFLSLYVLAIGPLDYFVLRRFDRMEWTWLTFPATVVVAVCAAAWWATTAKGGDYLSNSVTVVDWSTGSEDARGREWVSIFCPRARRLAIRHSAPGSVVLPSFENTQGVTGGAAIVETADGTQLELPTQQWRNASFCTRFRLRKAGDLKLVSAPEGAALRLINTTPYRFRHGYALLGGQVRRIECPVGAEQPVLISGGKWSALTKTERRFWQNWPTSPGPFGPGDRHGNWHLSQIANVTGGADPIASWSLMDYQSRRTSPEQAKAKVDEARREAARKAEGAPAEGNMGLNQQQPVQPRASLIMPSGFAIPGRADPEAAVFVGWTEDLESSYIIEDAAVRRKHFALIRAVLEVEKADD